MSEWETSNKSPDFKAVGFRCHLGCFSLIRSIVNPQKCASDTLGMRIPDAVSGAAQMQMIQLQNYRQWDASLQADPWLFLGKSSKPPLLLSPPLEISREYIPYSPIFRCEHTLVSPSPAGREWSWSSRGGCPAPGPWLCWLASWHASSARKDKHDPKHDPVGLSHLPGGFVPTPAGLGRWHGAAVAIFSLFS